jgi:hypothetical protein
MAPPTPKCTTFIFPSPAAWPESVRASFARWTPRYAISRMVTGYPSCSNLRMARRAAAALSRSSKLLLLSGPQHLKQYQE